MPPTRLELAILLTAWRTRLTERDTDGSLASVAREALQMDGEPPELTVLIHQWAAGDFPWLPPIKVLESSIYWNCDLLFKSNPQPPMSTLNGEIRHHRYWQMSSGNTQNDEDEELFTGKIEGIQMLCFVDHLMLLTLDILSNVHLDSQLLEMGSLR